MNTVNNVWKFSLFVIFFAFASISSPGEPGLEKKVNDLSARGDYASIVKLIDQQEREWVASPSVGYFSNMFSIATLIANGETNARIYWLGRKAMWSLLLKPTPNLYGAAQSVRSVKEAMFFLEAEDTAHIENLSPAMYAPIRHDTFLMLSEYARQVHTTIIPGFHNKFVLGTNPHTQNAIDNQVQAEARYALRWLAQNQLSYLDGCI